MRRSSGVDESFRSVSDQISVRELVPIIKTSEAKFLVIERSDGGYALWRLRGSRTARTSLDVAADRLGPSILQFALWQVPGFTTPCLPIEQNDAISWAQRWNRLEQSPNGCTIVLRNGRVIGVLSTTSRTEHLTRLPGLRYALFQVDEGEAQAQPKRSCPQCGTWFSYYDIDVVDGGPVFACPSCKQVVEDPQ